MKIHNLVEANLLAFQKMNKSNLNLISKKEITIIYLQIQTLRIILIQEEEVLESKQKKMNGIKKSLIRIIEKKNKLQNFQKNLSYQLNYKLKFK